jgi:uncharacterized membrane protein YoaK (UPF0700 family)
MAYSYDIPNMSGGMDSLLSNFSTAVPVFIPMFLLFVYSVVALGGSIAQRRRTGFSDYPLWSMLGCIAILMVSLGLAIGTNIISPVVLTVVVTITIANGVWLFLDTNRNEAFT